MELAVGIVLVIVIGALVAIVLATGRRGRPMRGPVPEAPALRRRSSESTAARHGGRADGDPYEGLPANHVLTRPPMVRDPELNRDVTLRDWLRNRYYAQPNVWNGVVAEFYTRAAANPRVAEYFAPTLSKPNGMTDLQNHFLRALLLVTSSGVSVGVVRTLRARHSTVRNLSGGPIDSETYDHVLGVLVEILREHGVPDEGISQLATTVAPLRGAVAVG